MRMVEGIGSPEITCFFHVGIPIEVDKRNMPVRSRDPSPLRKGLVGLEDTIFDIIEKF